MKIVLTGATGFIGRALCLRLRRDGHTLSALVRSKGRARLVLEAGTDLVDISDDAAVTEALDGADAVVNLAGAPVVGKRWSAAVKAQLVSSRVDLTRRLVTLMASAPSPPRVLVSGSAVGIYGDAASEVVTEERKPANDFLAKLCVDWEAEALRAEEHGVRVAIPRTGIVLGAEGGALASMLPPFRAGLGGPIGHGKQFMAWIHLSDVLEILAQALVDDTFRGPFNLAAPEPVTSEEFARALGKAVRRPARVRAPAFALKLALGEAAGVLLASQRAKPAKLTSWGYKFAWPDLQSTLRDVLEGGAPEIGAAPKSLPKTEYLARRGATHVLATETTLDAPLSEVFEFFSAAENLGALTPPALSFEIQPPLPLAIEVGTLIRYRIKLGPIPMTWVTRFDVWDDQERFVDSQLKGPYRSWWHEHAFEARGDQTVMRDTVYFKAPFGPLGHIAGALFIRPLLRRIFGFRHHAVLARYGDPPLLETAACPASAA